jgi:hypothetical protein
MKLSRWFIITGLLALFVTACASVPMASKEMDAVAKAFSPPPGQANLYIVRTARLIGDVTALLVVVDGKTVGSLLPGTYLLITVSPGSHGILISGKGASASVKLKTTADSNTYVEATFSVGAAIGRLDEDKGKQIVMAGRRAESLTDE